MKILINASNLKLGGGVQVADSVCGQLNRFRQHEFVVVLSKYLTETKKRIEGYANVDVVDYDVRNSFETLVFGRDKFLDTLVENRAVECVVTIFGPSRWNPKVRHISGFAMSHLVLSNSPYFKVLRGFGKFKSRLKNAMLDVYFRRSTDEFYTENPYISELLSCKWPSKRIYTITNYYNQIFDNPQAWQHVDLPKFDGTTLLCVSANYPHKNLGIARCIAYYLRDKYPSFRFRFVFTISSEQYYVPDELKEYFVLLGKVDISECPSLYEQADIAFQPTLLECFTATYPESMRMKRPIITTDLEFARGLCGDAALYYSPLSADQAAECIFRLSNDDNLRNQLVEAGQKQLARFDNYSERAEKIISLCEKPKM